MIYKIEEINRVAREVIKRSKSKVILFDAPMGAGKTTLIKSMCRELGIKEEITSPTFSIVNQHYGKENKIYHFDLYRIENTDQLFDIGFEDYLENDAFCLIEWPEISISLLSDYQKIKIEILDPETRELKFID
ncbi:tRNA (adenosine(37)-N6)-threonylcarbamoyltransferase complex ATPase subunit type 1 TsaE [uncultured Nonlabens sp.]|uniref:tRNA (adenosine(37)-N6)-threonylcarbamoyltransferase complex ATPase subunit type 1 TsaE n=1 Tax=uncultured Nonlabens sp. TaxID=859306 RepID=UPI0026196825|nr:tRNA (adenosine(37)-N6)-threonylcarbamoyltransferase complex ATPase subunit type 1 TsaE [uncultured Nonlabens sp.]